jgi:hypothetical protein
VVNVPLPLSGIHVVRVSAEAADPNAPSAAATVQMMVLPFIGVEIARLIIS